MNGLGMDSGGSRSMPLAQALQGRPQPVGELVDNAFAMDLFEVDQHGRRRYPKAQVQCLRQQYLRGEMRFDR
ncbi:hypothetical protein, partial [Escherichia coli]|uniref:hypothetical protein n=1 Tax=Escherichia coli TaxID=562 RepID=UPI0015C18966